VAIHDERRSEARSTLHRTWNVSVDSAVFGSRCAQVLDYSPSGIKLSLATVAWCRQQQRTTTIGAELSKTATGLNQAC
jgi:hypothetical protein